MKGRLLASRKKEEAAICGTTSQQTQREREREKRHVWKIG